MDDRNAVVPTNLQQFTQRIPPGWNPNMKDYPFRLYLIRLTLWWRCCDVNEEAAGPLVASRLSGRAFDVATKLRVERNGVVHVGEAALSLAAQAADAGPPSVEADISGLGHLLRRLVEEFQMHDQDYQNVVLDRFFDLRRSQRGLMSYITDWRLFLEEAETLAGIQMNNIAKTYLFFKWSGISQRRIDDIKLHVGGDLNRYDDIMALILRIAKQEQASGSHSHEYYQNNDEDGYQEDLRFLGRLLV